MWSNPLRHPTQIPYLVRVQEVREKKEALLPGEPPTDSKRCHPLLPCLLEESLPPRFHPGSSEGWSTKPPVEPLLPQVWSFHNSIQLLAFHSRIVIKCSFLQTHYQSFVLQATFYKKQTKNRVIGQTCSFTACQIAGGGQSSTLSSLQGLQGQGALQGQAARTEAQQRLYDQIQRVRSEHQYHADVAESYNNGKNLSSIMPCAYHVVFCP